MDLGSALIGGIIIIICCLPFIFMYRKQRKRKRQILRLLNHQAGEQECELATSDFYGNFAIGIDKKQEHVFFTKKVNDRELNQSVPLSAYSVCEVEKKYSKSTKERPSVLEYVRIRFYPVSEHDESVAFELYNANHYTQIYQEFEAAKKWSSLINKRLLEQKQPVEQAV